MPYLKTIVDFINKHLSDTVLKDKRFLNNKIIGIAQSMVRIENKKTQLLPSYVDNNGEGRYVGPDDSFDLIIYHKINSIGIGKSARNKGYGDDKGYELNLTKISMVVFGRRDKLKLTNDEMALYLQSNIPDAVPATMLQQLQFKTLDITTNDIVLNDLQVFTEEYEGFNYFLKPDQFLFKLNYSIESTFLKKCFTTCN